MLGVLVSEQLKKGATVQDEQLRQTGIGVVGDVPWGTHFFLFHETKEDLIDACVPYFHAGLENRELCMWVIADPLTEEEARYCLKHTIPGFDDYFENRSLEIVRGREWYMSGDDLDLEKVTRGWKQKRESAINGGYAGFRLSADTAWLDRRDWKEFSEYEKEVNESIGDTPMLALCTYPLPGAAAAEILDVMHAHHFALARRNKEWEVMETAELKQAKAEIQRLNNDLERRVLQRTSELTAVNGELRSQMSERQRAEEALRKTQERLSVASQFATVGELAASIAHEVSQPLAAVVSNGNACLRWLSAQPPNIAKAVEAAERIVRDGKDAGEVVRRVRALFKRAPHEEVTLDLNEVIGEVLSLLQSRTAMRRVIVETDLGPDLPPVIGDRVQLQQLILNLALNGIEAMDPVTDRAKRLFIRSKRESEDAVLVEIRDSGVGLKDPDAVFDAFFTTKENGMGMGLAICRSIVQSHNGRLWAASGEGPGATFCFTLPLQLSPAS